MGHDQHASKITLRCRFFSCKQHGSVTFFACADESGRMINRYSLKVHADKLDRLYDKLVEMGAAVKKSA